MSSKINCPNCGGEVSRKKGEVCGVCEYCGNMVTSAPVTGDNVKQLLRQAQLFLTTGDFASARKLCEEILEVDHKNGLVYFYLVLAELQTNSKKELIKIDFTENKNYKLARFFGNDELNAQLDYYVEERQKMERIEAERREKTSRERRDKIRELTMCGSIGFMGVGALVGLYMVQSGVAAGVFLIFGCPVLGFLGVAISQEIM